MNSFKTSNKTGLAKTAVSLAILNEPLIFRKKVAYVLSRFKLPPYKVSCKSIQPFQRKRVTNTQTFAYIILV